MNARTPPVSVVIASSGCSTLLESCLRRVRAQVDALDGEVVLVINDSPERAPGEGRDTLMALVDRLDFEPRVGKSHALNRGVEISRGRVLVFTDDDALPHEGWLDAITRPLRDPERPAALVGCGGRVLPVFSGEIPLWYERLTSTRHTHFLGPKHDLGDEPVQYGVPPRDRCAPLGANCAYLREVLLRNPYLPELGPNRQTGLRGGEDFELAFRLLGMGLRIVYRPDACVEHPVTEGRLTLDYVRQGYYLQGIEGARIDHALGRDKTPLKLLLKLLHRRLRVGLHRPGDSPAQVRREMKMLLVSGQVAETVRLNGGDEAFPDDPDLAAICRWGLRRVIGANARKMTPSRGATARPEARRGTRRDPSP